MVVGATSVSQVARRPARLVSGVAIELLVLVSAIGVAVASYLLIAGIDKPQHLLPPPLIAFLLVANVTPGIALMALFGRRFARRRALRSVVGGEGQLHVRLVAIFSAVAAVPVLLVTIVASLLFQYGVEFWISGQAGGLLENTQVIAKQSMDDAVRSVDNENIAMATDIYKMLVVNRWPLDDPSFARLFAQDVFQRSLAQSVLFSIGKKGDFQREALVNYYEGDLLKQIDPASIQKVAGGTASVASISPAGTHSVTRVPGTAYYLFSTRVVGTKELLARMRRVHAVVASYQAVQHRARRLQILFNTALFLLALLIVAVTIWIALRVADRLVAPVGELVEAARRVESGDLTARVPDPRSRDEVGTLAAAFNQMTGRLQQQNTALLTANDQLESRRALIEAVMGGVSAGVVSVADDRSVRIINRSAMALLDTGEASPVGRPLAEIAPELDRLIDGAGREAVVQVQAGAELRTLAVRIARADAGPILTFDDMTQQLQDQRRAAWADVARRIAHEIKNPLTPIQLAAERLQRRYGRMVEAGDTTFERLTETIVRQVGDLRRMVDEFSSFARMPKPVFRAEALLDIVRQSVFLHEVAHPGVRFSLDHDGAGPTLVCDRRQIGQAMTNIIKNAVEAVEAKGVGGGFGAGGEVVVALGGEDARAWVSVADDGIGLPPERDRILEPYMTTRARGTGLGLAIVRKIVEEHAGTIAFADRPGGGTIVTIAFDTAVLAGLDQGPEDDDHSLHHAGGLATLTSRT